MDKVRVYYDAFAKTLTVWLGDPSTEHMVQEVDDDTVFIKDASGQTIRFEKLNLASVALGLTVEMVNSSAA